MGAKKKAAKKTAKKTSSKPPSAAEGAPEGTQALIPGTEEHHEDVTNAAVRYRKKRDARLQLNREEADAKQTLIDTMLAHDLKVYEDSGQDLRVEIEPGDVNVKVKKLDVE